MDDKNIVNIKKEDYKEWVEGERYKYVGMDKDGHPIIIPNPSYNAV
mgnify:CR=1 FL=1|jgi:hypothetical protein